MPNAKKPTKIDQRQFAKWLRSDQMFNDNSVQRGLKALQRHREPIDQKIKALAEKSQVLRQHLDDTKLFASELPVRIQKVNKGKSSYRELYEWLNTQTAEQFTPEKYTHLAGLLEREGIRDNFDQGIFREFFNNLEDKNVGARLTPLGIDGITLLPMPKPSLFLVPSVPPISQGDVAKRQDELGDAESCGEPPYPSNAGFVQSGNSLASLRPSPAINPALGTFSTDGLSSFVPGGGANATAMVGRDFPWGPGFTTASIVVKVRAFASFTTFGVGGAWSGGSILLTASITGGPSFRSESSFELSVVPILWGSKTEFTGNKVLNLTIPVSSNGGAMRINVGGYACVGTVLITGAQGIVSGTVESICVTFH